VLTFDTKDTQRRKDIDIGGTQCKQNYSNNTFNNEVLTRCSHAELTIATA